MQKIFKIEAYLEANGKSWEDARGKVEISHNSVDDTETIAKWDISDLAQPTEEQLNALETEATTIKTNAENKANNRATLKASAKAKLIAGEALTQEEADTIVL